MSTDSESASRAAKLIRGLDVTVALAAVLFWVGVLFWAQTQAISQVRYAAGFVGGLALGVALLWFLLRWWAEFLPATGGGR